MGSIVVLLVVLVVAALIAVAVILWALNRRDAQALECAYDNCHYAAEQLSHYAVCRSVLVKTAKRIKKVVASRTPQVSATQ